jgi:hypothetical protein
MVESHWLAQNQSARFFLERVEKELISALFGPWFITHLLR